MVIDYSKWDKIEVSSSSSDEEDADMYAWAQREASLCEPDRLHVDSEDECMGVEIKSHRLHVEDSTAPLAMDPEDECVDVLDDLKSDRLHVEESDEIRDASVPGEEWARVLTSTAFAAQHLHPALGPGWTAILLEACCIRAKDQRVHFLNTQAIWPWARTHPWALNKLSLRLGDCQPDWSSDSEESDDTSDSDEGTLGLVEEAAGRGSLSMVRWLRERGCRWSSLTCELGRTPGRSQVRPRERLRLECSHMLRGSVRRPLERAQVRTRERMPLG